MKRIHFYFHHTIHRTENQKQNDFDYRLHQNIKLGNLYLHTQKYRFVWQKIVRIHQKVECLLLEFDIKK